MQYGYANHILTEEEQAEQCYYMQNAANCWQDLGYQGLQLDGLRNAFRSEDGPYNSDMMNYKLRKAKEFIASKLSSNV